MMYTIDFYLKRLGFFAFTGIISINVISSGCQRPKDTGQETTQVPDEQAVPDTLPGDFVSFFDQFHTDSAYQMEHILFPLEGLPGSEEADSTKNERFYWQKEDWVMHHKFNDPSDRFEHWYQVLDPRIIEHWVQLKGTDMVIRRRFAKLDDGWYLIYYAALRPFTPEG